MEARIVRSAQKTLAGKRMAMSFANNQIAALWKQFAPAREKITNRLNKDLISMVIYQPGHFLNFDPTREFERWAAVEVKDMAGVPQEFETFILPAGLYAVFDYKGLSTDNSVFQYIFGEWLPNSDYLLDNRPHFEILGSKYKNNDPDSEEEIWIPVRHKPGK